MPEPLNLTDSSSLEGLGMGNGEWEMGNWELGMGNWDSELRTQNPELITQNSEPRTQNSEPRTQNPELRTLAADEVRILAPEPGTIGDRAGGSFAARAANLIVQYRTGSTIEVRLNGNPLPQNAVSSAEAGEDNTTTEIFYNLPLDTGDNQISVSANGGTPVTLNLAVEEPTVQLQLIPLGNPSIPADGRSTVTFEGTLTDEEGALLTQDAIVTLTASAGEFIGADHDEDQPGFQTLATNGRFSAQLKSGLDTQKVRVRAAIERTGQPSDLQWTQESELETYAQVEFVTHLRPSLVSGVIDLRIGQAGTDFWGSRSLFLNPDLIEEGYGADLSAAIFATGSFGEWRFTGAVNSERPLNQTCDGITRLFRGPQFCEQQYPVYGDSSTVEYTTPSINSFYARIERNSPIEGAGTDYFMWGDFRSASEFARASQQFTGVARELNGFLGNYNLGNLQLSALFSPDAKGFQRDTIAPDGTSGYYFLSRRNLVPGSESIYIESEELNRPGTVIDRKQVFRGPDYEIDYDRGTLLFRRPVLATGVEDTEGREMTVVRRVVATYQYEGNNENTFIYGGRAQYNFSHDLEAPIWIGATYYTEDQDAQEYTLYGADFLVSLGKIPGTNIDRGRFVGEFARSDANNLSLLGGNSTFDLLENPSLNPSFNRSGNAYRLEFIGNLSENITARAYYRSVEEDFVNNATISYTPGQTRYGGELTAALSPRTTARASYEFEENFGFSSAVRRTLFDPFNPAFDLFSPTAEAPRGAQVNNELRTIRAGVEQQIGRADLSVEYINRLRTDDISRGGVAPPLASRSDQIVTNLRVPVLCEDEECDRTTLALRAQNETNVTGDDPLYPNRTTFGIDWIPQQGTTIRLAHQFLDGGQLGYHSLTSLSTISERHLGEDTTVTSRYSILSGINGVMSEGGIGFNHRMTLAPGLRATVGYERIVNEFIGDTAAGSRFVQPFAAGQSASSLGLTDGDSYSVGIEYTASPDFKASARLESRNSSYGHNTVIEAGAAGKISTALTGLMRFQQASSATPFLEDLGPTATLRLGLAYRDPNDDRLNALLRYEYRSNPTNIPETLLVGSGTSTVDHVLAAEAIYAPNWQWELYGKYAMRNSTTFLSDDFSNSSTIHLGQLRATYRFAYQWDATLEGRAIGQPSAGFTELGWAAELGFYPLPDLRLGVGYAFGSVDDRDFSGYRSQDGIYFGVTFKVNELFGGFGRQQVTPPQQEESEVQNSEVRSQESESRSQNSESRSQNSESRIENSEVGTFHETSVQNFESSEPFGAELSRFAALQQWFETSEGADQ
ncbi:MAG: hypothetical protein SW833_08525 [Cyanobacteriota bacterium]|nr:hypothetical protein [Cyanobacteriota bacterium]